ncbi:PIG-L family deacetylase [Nonomuraea sp. NN258]|uniref:PIG-L deacetylase family protein n=1 Tax=Nonomuraea antri TaxID=2730852 RepID=UPI001568AA84|nr:PIG-L deacetylase family protein [Nonomuraea antri]NRQ32024.1 PIG-L family deacetylase [Nonomuraea antri]
MAEQLKPMPADWQRALAVVAHPDDLEYGCASAVAVWTDAGREVSYLLATRGEAGIDTLPPAEAGPLREREQRASASVVGVSNVEFLAYSDGVIEYSLALRRDIAAAIRRYRPELVITLNPEDTWGGLYWNTPDHKAVGRAVLDAAGDAGNRWIFPDTEAEPWTGVRWVAVAGSDAPTHAVDVTGGLERGVRSLLEHRAYLEALGQDPEPYATSLVEGSAKDTAERFGGLPAVSFRLYDY